MTFDKFCLRITKYAVTNITFCPFLERPSYTQVLHIKVNSR